MPSLFPRGFGRHVLVYNHASRSSYLISSDSFQEFLAFFEITRGIRAYAWRFAALFALLVGGYATWQGMGSPWWGMTVITVGLAPLLWFETRRQKKRAVGAQTHPAE